MKILFVIVTYNAMPWIDRCIGSALSSEDEKLKVGIFVVDNCSTDGTPTHILEHYPTVKLLRNNENRGFGAANNEGLRYAMENGYDFAYLLNQDAWLLPGALAAIAEAAKKGKKYAVLSPLQLQANELAFDPQFGKRNAPRDGQRKPYKVKRVMAAHWLLRIQAVKQVGVFAPIFEHYGEDDNLCDRLRAAGWHIGVVPKAKAIHDRAKREEPLEVIIRRNYYVKSLVDLCNPNFPLWFQWVKVIPYTIVKAVKYRSFKPFGYFVSLIRQSGHIQLTRGMKK